MGQAPRSAPNTRGAVSVDEVKAMLELRLFEPRFSAPTVALGAKRAASLGLATVICRPEHLASAAQAVTGSRVQVCTAVDFDNPRAPQPPPKSWPNRPCARPKQEPHHWP